VRHDPQSTAQGAPSDPLGLQAGTRRASALYDELIRFRKGAKRVSRLRLLAYDGLLAQNGVLVSDGLAARADGHGAGAEEGASAVTNDLFAPAIEA
jgi:hypothetical protein